MTGILNPIKADREARLSKHVYSTFQQFLKDNPLTPRQDLVSTYVQMLFMHAIQCAIVEGGGMSADETAAVARAAHAHSMAGLNRARRTQ
ncbi:MAG: hypothetical protein U1E62_05310 [Alsobacter sp.]